MTSAKDIRVAPISSKDARDLILRLHYSGKVKGNSQLHFGVFLAGKLEGAMSFGPSIDKRKMLGLVEDTKWNGFLELNRMAFSERLPRNSESRALAVAFRLIKRHYPHVEWVVSFSDAAQCGDGAIYRAAGFWLTAIESSKHLARLPSGEVIHVISLNSNPLMPRPELGGRTYFDVTGGRRSFGRYVEAAEGKILEGFQMRYLIGLNDSVRSRLRVPVLPFSAIGDAGASMYRGEKIMREKQAMGGDQPPQRRCDTDPHAPFSDSASGRVSQAVSRQ